MCIRDSNRNHRSGIDESSTKIWVETNSSYFIIVSIYQAYNITSQLVHLHTFNLILFNIRYSKLYYHVWDIIEIWTYLGWRPWISTPNGNSRSAKNQTHTPGIPSSHSSSWYYSNCNTMGATHCGHQWKHLHRHLHSNSNTTQWVMDYYLTQFSPPIEITSSYPYHLPPKNKTCQWQSPDGTGSQIIHLHWGTAKEN